MIDASVLSVQIFTSDGRIITVGRNPQKHQVQIDGFGLNGTIFADTQDVLALRDALNLVYGP
jgi:hypothetical protein